MSATEFWDLRSSLQWISTILSSEIWHCNLVGRYQWFGEIRCFSIILRSRRRQQLLPKLWYLSQIPQIFINIIKGRRYFAEFSSMPLHCIGQHIGLRCSSHPFLKNEIKEKMYIDLWWFGSYAKTQWCCWSSFRVMVPCGC
jgi:hypothetical protein